MSKITIPHPRKLMAFALLSVADLYLTSHLLQRTDGRVYESNPVASAWLESFGWLGLAAFKALAMLIVAGLAIIISRHRPHAGSGILWFACTITAVVVGYSCFLSGYFGLTPGQLQADEVERAEQQGFWLDQVIGREREYTILVSRLGKDLAAGRRTLTQAVERLAACEKTKNSRWLEMLHQKYPDRSDKECLAIHLANHTLGRLSNDPARMKRLAQQLEADFHAGFGSAIHFDLEIADSTTGKRQPQVSAGLPFSRTFPVGVMR